MAAASSLQIAASSAVAPQSALQPVAAGEYDSENTPSAAKAGRIVFSKAMLLKFRTNNVCMTPPPDLPDMRIEKLLATNARVGRPKTWREPKSDRPKAVRSVVPLKMTDKGWKPTQSKTELEAAEKKVKGILNKMTKEKFDALSTQMCEIPVASDEMMAMMIDHIHQKAINEATFGDMYADLCLRLSNEKGHGKAFKRALLNKCEKEFTACKSRLVAAQKAEDDDGTKELLCIKLKKQMLGNTVFIGQLYRNGLLKEKIIRFCIASLLKLEPDDTGGSKVPEFKDSLNACGIDLDDHETICCLFTTIGATIDKPSASNFMNVCFTKIKKLSRDKENLPPRSRFLYQDLLELREKKQWVSARKEAEKARTLKEIKDDFVSEETKKTLRRS